MVYDRGKKNVSGPKPFSKVAILWRKSKFRGFLFELGRRSFHLEVENLPLTGTEAQEENGPFGGAYEVAMRAKRGCNKVR